MADESRVVPDAAITKSLTDLLERWEDEVGRPG